MERTEEKIVLPMAVTFDCGTCTLRAAAAGDGGQRLPKVKILAYSGGPMRVSGYWDNVIIDLAGARFASYTTPLILDHDTGQRIGHTESQVIDGGKITASGVISAGSQAAADLVADAKNGFPFQASVGADIAELQRVREKESVVVNGKTYTGPLNVVRKCMIREISLTVLGADSRTSVSIAAARAKKGLTSMSKEQELDLEAGGDGVATLDGEMERAEAINAICDSEHWTDARQAAHISDLRAQAMQGELRIKDLVAKVNKARELKALRAGRVQAPNTPGRHFTRDDHLSAIRGERAGDADTVILEASLARHCGLRDIEKHYGPRVAEASDRVGITHFMDAAKILAEHSGVIGFRNKDAILRCAFSTMGLTKILENIAGKQLLDSFNSYPSAFKLIARKLSASDFKEATGIRLGGDLKFQELGASGEIKHGELSESYFTFQLGTRARMFSLTRVDMINDGLNAFSEVPRIVGRGSATALEEDGWKLVLANTGSFFATGNGNYQEGADTALDIDSLGAAVMLMRKQTDAHGAPIAVQPKWLCVPPELETLADTLFTSANIVLAGDTDVQKPDGNPFKGKYQPLVVPHLSNSLYTNNSAKGWYLFGPSTDVACFGVAYLDGSEIPVVESSDSEFNTLGIQFRGFLDWAVCQVEKVGGVFSKGEA